MLSCNAQTGQRLEAVVCASLGAEFLEQARANAGQVGAAAAQHEVGGNGRSNVARALEGSGDAKRQNATT